MESHARREVQKYEMGKKKQSCWLQITIIIQEYLKT